MALSADRNTPRLEGDVFSFPVLQATTIFAGGIVALDSSGWAKPGATATGLTCVGRAEEQVDNSGGQNGDRSVRVRAGTFRFNNSTDTDAITRADIGNNCYIVDDETVAKTSGSSTRSIAGRVMDVDAQGVWVECGVGIVNAPGGALLAANNLSDVGNKVTARTQLGVYEKLGTPAITVGAQAEDVINVAIQLKDSAGADLAVRGSILAYLSDDANGDSIAASAPSGGVDIGTDGVAIPLVDGKAFQLVSEADGDIDLDIEESGAATFYLVLVMPDGRLVASEAITFTT